MKELIQGQLGVVGQYDVKIENGELVVSVKVSGAAGLDALAKLIPGQIDDAILGIIKSALMGI